MTFEAALTRFGNLERRVQALEATAHSHSPTEPPVDPPVDPPIDPPVEPPSGLELISGEVVVTGRAARLALGVSAPSRSRMEVATAMGVVVHSSDDRERSESYTAHGYTISNLGPGDYLWRTELWTVDNVSETPDLRHEIPFNIELSIVPPIEIPDPVGGLPNPVWGMARDEDNLFGTPGWKPGPNEVVVYVDTIAGNDSDTGRDENSWVRSLARCQELADGKDVVAVHKWRPEPLVMNPRGDVRSSEWWLAPPGKGWFTLMSEPGKQQLIHYTYSGGHSIRRDQTSMVGFKTVYIGPEPAQPPGRAWMGAGFGAAGKFRPDGQRTYRAMHLAMSSVNSAGGGGSNRNAAATVTAFCTSDEDSHYHYNQASAFSDWEMMAKASDPEKYTSVFYGNAGLSSRSFVTHEENGKSDSNVMIVDYNESTQGGVKKPTVIACMIGIGCWGRGIQVFNSSHVLAHFNTMIGNSQKLATPQRRRENSFGFQEGSELSVMGYGYHSTDVEYKGNLIIPGTWSADHILIRGDVSDVRDIDNLWMPAIQTPLSPDEARAKLAATPIQSQRGALNHQGKFRISLAEAIALAG